MTKKRDFKQLIRERMEKTGESYTAARRSLEGAAGADGADGAEPEMALPTGWRRMTEKGMPEDYAIGVDRTQGYRTSSSALIRSRRDDATASATRLMQYFLADDYRGCRLRLSAWIKTEALTGACRLWMEIDENKRMCVAATSEPVTGTTTWMRREIVLDVEPAATLVLIGILVDGAGAAWISDVAIDKVELDVPATAGELPAAPRNLTFAE